MATTHVPVTNYYDVYDLWAAGLLYAHGKLCVFPSDMDPSDEWREMIVRSWSSSSGMRKVIYTYRTEE